MSATSVALQSDMTVLEKYTPLLRRALAEDGGTHAVEDVFAAILSGYAQLWLGDDAVVVTQIENHAQMKEILFWLAAGDMDGVLGLEQPILRWAKEHGCAQAVFAGRKGWTRVLEERGWEQKMVLCRKEL